MAGGKATAKQKSLPSLKLTFSPLKIDGWKMNFLLGSPIFRGELLVLGRVHPRKLTWIPTVDIFERRYLEMHVKKPILFGICSSNFGGTGYQISTSHPGIFWSGEPRDVLNHR